jgi:hypothetical protein
MACLRFSCRTTLRSSGMCAFHFFFWGVLFFASNHRLFDYQEGILFCFDSVLANRAFCFSSLFWGRWQLVFFCGGGEDSIRVHIYLLKRALSFFFSFSTYHSWLVHQEVLVINGFFFVFFF